jgi:hypothetical protein
MDHKAKKLPQIVKQFLEAANQWDATLATACFTPKALVRDEDRDYEGRKAIHGWVAETSRRYHPAFIPLQTFVSDDVVTGQIAVSGKFPGSPVTLDYEFRVHHGMISALTIV